MFRHILPGFPANFRPKSVSRYPPRVKPYLLVVAFERKKGENTGSMLKIIFLLIALVSISFAEETKLVNPESRVQLKNSVENIISPQKLKDLKAGILISSAQTGEVLYEQNADELLIPASVNKIFTSYAALKRLKPNFTFKTYVYAKGSIQNETLAGDLYFKGGGDPSLVSERLWMLVNDLTRAGIKKVLGNIIVDSSFYDSVRTPEARPKYLKDQAYNAPIGGLSFNFNTCTVYVKPGQKVGSSPIVYTDPENTYIDVVNQATTSKAGADNTLAVNRTEYVKGDLGDTVLLRGAIPLDHKEVRFYKNIVNPALYAGHMFKTFMVQRGFKISGNVVEGMVPENAKQLLEFESQPLWQIVWGMNKFSNNFVADQTLKRLGAEVWGVPGTMEKGITALENVLEDVGIPKNLYKIVDGSGLTRETKVTARQIGKVLQMAYKDFSSSPEFIASLGIGGEDGTMKRRTLAVNESIVRAKTGSLDGVSSLAGYVTSADNEILTFAILLNDPKLKYGKMSTWADQIAVAASKFHR
ncbi:MAG: D-alanyl-D-alanine carboxypeptidase/D-alanyl-D-alanine-endopeptidase [Deltaproteobacteria bacterium]|nr:D-alanyl-D-alanine carboxypeptidase/D-alanyl-D-alanine-endopeptidase [Deltaproteobacteria bacterium]